MSSQIDYSGFINNHSSEFRVTLTATVTINIVFGLTATILNGIIVIAMAKNVSLRTPSNALLFSLSLSDLGVGLIVQPFYVYRNLDWLLNPATDKYNDLFTALRKTTAYFTGISFLTMAEISLEKFLCFHYHLRYDALTTVGRVLAASIFPWVFCALVIALELFRYCVLILLPILIIQSIACYLKIFAVLRRHNNVIIGQLGAAEQQNRSSSIGLNRSQVICSSTTEPTRPKTNSNTKGSES